MRIEELEIYKFRGIKDLKILPAGENVLILGHNGTGKSGVVDALDFLFTGRILRLTGEGTGDISLKEHGKHIDDEAEEAVVRAMVRPQKDSEPVELARTISNSTLLFGIQNFSSNSEFIKLLSQGHHMLSRREILRFIATEPKDRAEQVQALLNISDIERIRKVLGKLSNEYERNHETVRREINHATDTLATNARLQNYSEEGVLTFVNTQRSLFKGMPLNKLSSTLVRWGIERPFIAGERPGQISSFEEDVSYTNALVSNVEKRQKLHAELHDLEKKVRATPELLLVRKRIRLYKSGIAAIGQDGSCPLCGVDWKPGELQKHLNEHLKKAEQADAYAGALERIGNELGSDVRLLLNVLKRLMSVSNLVGLSEINKNLSTWGENLQALETFINTELHSVPDRYGASQIANLLAPKGIEQDLADLGKRVTSDYPASSPEQTAWEQLAILEDNLKSFESLSTNYRAASKKAALAKKMQENFLVARDEVLNGLYNSIEERFAEFYRYVHGQDEAGFTAKLIPDDASLNLRVDFYGRGMYSPQALHSEGHQDSMGLCLYLALVEKLTGGLIDLIILDDVLMSVDSMHRRKVCSLLKEFFSDYQFVITTHDEVWASQLAHEGVITNKGRVEFYDWDLDTGPKVNYETDFWTRISENLANNQVPAAAALLRRGSELFFGNCCELLRAPVVYKGAGRYSLGDFLPAAYGRMNKLIKDGKVAAESWGNQEKAVWLTEYEDNLKSAHLKANAEKWAINETVHFNEWVAMNKNDFNSVVDAFAALYRFFQCDVCNQIVRIVYQDQEPVSVQCNCKKHDWGLVKRKQ